MWLDDGIKKAMTLPSQLSLHTQSQNKNICALNQSNPMAQSLRIFLILSSNYIRYSIIEGTII